MFGEKLKTESGGYQVVVERCLEEAGGARRVCVSRGRETEGRVDR